MSTASQDGEAPPESQSSESPVPAMSAASAATASQAQNAWLRYAAVLSRWSLVWLLIVTLGFVWLRLTRTALPQGPSQYLSDLSQVMRGDFGIATPDGPSVIVIVVAGLPVDVLLTAGAWLAAWCLGAVWGLLAAARAKHALGGWLMEMARGVVSLSVVVLVPLGMLLIGAAERWSMITGGAGLWLPMLALAVPYAAQVARSTHREALLALASEPVFMARAMGLPPQRIWAERVLPAAWRSPVSTRRSLVSLFTSVIVIENLLGTLGTGPYFLAAARQQDHAVVVALGIVYSTLFIVLYLLADWVRVRRAAACVTDARAAREAA